MTCLSGSTVRRVGQHIFFTDHLFEFQILNLIFHRKTPKNTHRTGGRIGKSHFSASAVIIRRENNLGNLGISFWSISSTNKSNSHKSKSSWSRKSRSHGRLCSHFYRSDHMYRRQGLTPSISVYQEYNFNRSSADELPPQYHKEEPPPSYNEAVMETHRTVAQQRSSSNSYQDSNGNN